MLIDAREELIERLWRHVKTNGYSARERTGHVLDALEPAIEDLIRRERRRAAVVAGAILMAVGIALGWLVGSASAATVEIQVTAKRDGWARLHAEGMLVPGDGTLLSSRGKPTTRRVKVHKGRNEIRLKAFRWEDMDVFDYVAKYPPETRPAAWPLVAQPLNWVYVWGRVAGRDIEPIEQKVSG